MSPSPLGSAKVFLVIRGRRRRSGSPLLEQLIGGVDEIIVGMGRAIRAELLGVGDKLLGIDDRRRVFFFVIAVEPRQDDADVVLVRRHEILAGPGPTGRCPRRTQRRKCSARRKTARRRRASWPILSAPTFRDRSTKQDADHAGQSRPRYSSNFRLAALTTSRNLATSLFMILMNSSGVAPPGLTAIALSFCDTPGSAIASANAFCSFATTGAGVALGAKMPLHRCTSTSG